MKGTKMGTMKEIALDLTQQLSITKAVLEEEIVDSFFFCLFKKF